MGVRSEERTTTSVGAFARTALMPRGRTAIMNGGNDRVAVSR